MKVIVALTVKSSISFANKKKAHQAILELLPGASPMPMQAENKNNTTTLTYSEDRHIEAEPKQLDDVADLEIAKLSTQLRHKLTGLAGVKKIQIWWKYSAAPVRPDFQFLFD